MNKIEGISERELEIRETLNKIDKAKSLLKDFGVIGLLQKEQENHPGTRVIESDDVPAFCDKSWIVYASLVLGSEISRGKGHGVETRIGVLGENSVGLGILEKDKISYVPIEKGKIESAILEALKDPLIKY